MKLFYHLFGYLVLGMIALIVTDEYLGFRAEIDQYERDMIAHGVQSGKSISAMIAHTWKENGPEKALQLIEDAGSAGQIKIRWVWLDQLDRVFAGSQENRMLLSHIGNNETVSLKMGSKDGSKDGSDYRYTYVPVDIGEARKGVLELRQTLLSFRQYSKEMLFRALTITALLALICGSILYVFIDRKIKRPLKKLMAQAERIGRGDLQTEQSIPGNDELADMTRTMNDMCSRLLIAKDKIKFEYDARLKTLEQLRHTERLSSFGLISAGIAHELGTPLNVVDGRAKMIIHEQLQKEEIAECASIIIHQAERMAVIIRQLLDYTRRPKQHISLENIALLTKQVFQLLSPMARKQHVLFSLHKTDDTEVVLQSDALQIQQVLVNLLMNSIQAMPNGGIIDVSLANEIIADVSGPQNAEGKYLLIRIKDEGEGICQENLENIFTPFFTTKSIGTGTGLGLSIAHGIVEEHHGWIEVESSVHNGACFTVYLPMKDPNI